MKLAWIDTETTGLNPCGSARIVEVACIVTDDTPGVYHELGRFHRLFGLSPDDKKVAEPKALAINGFDDGPTGDWYGAPLPSADLWRPFLALTQDTTPVAQNWPFDRGFIEEALLRHNLFPTWERRFVDVMSFSWFLSRREGLKSFSLEGVYKAVGGPPLKAHRALADLAMEMYLVKYVDRLVGGVGGPQAARLLDNLTVKAG